jgi:hypothetical protein
MQKRHASSFLSGFLFFLLRRRLSLADFSSYTSDGLNALVFPLCSKRCCERAEE